MCAVAAWHDCFTLDTQTVRVTFTSWNTRDSQHKAMYKMPRNNQPHTIRQPLTQIDKRCLLLRYLARVEALQQPSLRKCKARRTQQLRSPQHGLTLVVSEFGETVLAFPAIRVHKHFAHFDIRFGFVELQSKIRVHNPSIETNAEQPYNFMSQPHHVLYSNTFGA